MSAYQKLDVSIKGITPCIMHNGQLADPLCEWTRAIKAITGKHHSKVTDQDREELIRLEWYGSLYLDEKGCPCWPGENIERMVQSAARKHRQGKDVEKGLTCPGNWPLIYSGPKTANGLWKLDPKFRKTCGAVIHGNRVMRSRPIFHDWALKFQLLWCPDYFNLEDVERWLVGAGSDIGLSEWRPKFGRFMVESFNGKG